MSAQVCSEQALATLTHELAQYSKLEDELRQNISTRSVALKQEELSIRSELDGVLVRQEMCQCEHACLEALLRDDKVWVIHHQAWYVAAAKASRSAAMERMDQNVWMTQEINRLQVEIEALERCDGSRNEGHGEAESPPLLLERARCVREARAGFAMHSERILASLEANAQEGRERYGRAMRQANEAIRLLHAGIVQMRNFLREIHLPDVANELIVWAEAGGRIARNKARWDFQHLLCPLDLVILEGLRLRLAELI
jgi:hypothetical protein